MSSSEAPAAARRGGRAQCVRYVVRTARLEHDRALAERTLSMKRMTNSAVLDGLHGIRRREVGRARDAKRDDARAVAALRQ